MLNNIKLHIGDIPSQKQIDREIFELKMLMLQSEKPQEKKRLSNAIKGFLPNKINTQQSTSCN